ncbi:Lrp/AsnC family transcriptional regulator [Gordonia sp. TBRC 11910]|uniref:Lrp/AsnC family transcriptional regulator n=1 Tax=Gordonia asplenii TaxID=2725283 RepID=A0A848KXT0_9ACTN|nr:Lrp/AsnC family transcriptional regulator [Gordonia asplenii]NMO03554.1 Lrp/AsnC family transcriptional regulator [Gordonia asplenii]
MAADGTAESRYVLDDVDRRILDELTRDARISVRALAERTHISRAHAYVRIDRLLAEGIIRGFTARIDHEKAGLTTSALVAMSIRQDSWRGIAEALRELPFVDHFALLGGAFDVLVTVRVPDNRTLRHLVLERLQGIDGVRSTTTWMVFEEEHGQGAQWV